MDIVNELKNNLGVVDYDKFEGYALELFRYQAENNPVYQRYIQALGIRSETISGMRDIPFMPIEFFKKHKVVTRHPLWKPEGNFTTFESSGTTGSLTSKHYLPDLDYYKKVTEQNFRKFYGSFDQYHILALLPSYLERKNASLVVMADHFIKCSGSPYSGFYLNDLEQLASVLDYLKKLGDRKILLLGVSFALLDLSERFNLELGESIVMETGGMKGRREEMVREELHYILEQKFKLKSIHSEYGMTELMSQAYAQSRGFFKTPPWMQVMIRDLNDPFYLNNRLRQGGINIIDLGNIHSCAFIATQDIGRFSRDGNSFEVLGRMDNSDIRGCNLLVA